MGIIILLIGIGGLGFGAWSAFTWPSPIPGGLLMMASVVNLLGGIVWLTGRP